MNYPNALKDLREQLELTYQKLYRIKGAIDTIEQILAAQAAEADAAKEEETTPKETTTEE